MWLLGCRGSSEARGDGASKGTVQGTRAWGGSRSCKALEAIRRVWNFALSPIKRGVTQPDSYRTILGITLRGCREAREEERPVPTAVRGARPACSEDGVEDCWDLLLGWM